MVRCERESQISILTERVFTIIDETDDWIVIDKPPFLQVHPKKPGGPPTLWDGLRGLLAFELVMGGQVSIINRLDRETSGIVLVCKTHEAARRFHMAMTRRAFRKEYLAIVRGWPAQDAFTVDAPILRQGERLPTAVYLKRCVHPDGAQAVTRFQVEQRFWRTAEKGIDAGARNGNATEERQERFALVRAFPLTGRTHQIRVHLAHAGHSIVGDKLYGTDERFYLEFIETGWTPRLQHHLLLNRHALHSAFLCVEDAGQRLEWRAPLPPDMAAWFLALPCGSQGAYPVNPCVFPPFSPSWFS